MYEPLRLAEEIAVLDQLTGGPLDLGVGSGVSPYELGDFGVDAARPGPATRKHSRPSTGALSTGRMRHMCTQLRDYDVELSVGPVQRRPAAVVRLVQHRHRRVGRGERRQLRRPVE